MNIFKSLSLGYGTISETNITSFLSYILNSTNELDNSFLLLFFDLIDKNTDHDKITDLLQLKQETLRERIIHFSKKYSVTAIPEYSVKKNNLKQVIDVLIKISDKTEDENDIAYILIENKIKPASANKTQVSKQFEFFKETEDLNKYLPVYSLLITSDFDSFATMHKNAKESNKNSIWVRWTNRNDKTNSIESALRKLLILEQQAEIQPINPNTQFILKSFIDYVVTEFANSSNGQRNYNINGSDEVDMATVIINATTYILRRYENKMIRVFDENDNILDIEVRPLLKQINNLNNLQIDTHHTTGTPKNTQVFGKEIISALNNPT